MARFTKIKRPTNLSRWAFFTTEEEQNFDRLAALPDDCFVFSE
jgi:hypothetical protein